MELVDWFVLHGRLKKREPREPSEPRVLGLARHNFAENQQNKNSHKIKMSPFHPHHAEIRLQYTQANESNHNDNKKERPLSLLREKTWLTNQKTNMLQTCTMKENQTTPTTVVVTTHSQDENHKRLVSKVPRNIAVYDWDNLHVDTSKPPLGTGGFNHVYALPLAIPKEQQQQQQQQENLKAPMVVVKRLRGHVDDKTRRQGMLDLNTEARLLSRLDHPHLMKLHGVSSDMESNPFLILSRVDQTLSEQLEQWQQQQQQQRQKATTTTPSHKRRGTTTPKTSSWRSRWRLLSNSPTITKKTTKKNNNKTLAKRGSSCSCDDGSWSQRINVAMELASVLEYLHENNVVYRDLKPSNVGIIVDENNNLRVQLLDLGLAKEIESATVSSSSLYVMTGQVGSWKYMAPEVAKGFGRYDASVDVYSYGMVLWEILSLRTALGGYTVEDIQQRVVRGPEDRPPVPTDWPTELQELLRACWSPFPARRPSWQDIQRVLHHNC